MKKSTRVASYIAIFGIVFATGLMVGNALPDHSLNVNGQGNGTSVLGGFLGGKSTQQEIDLKMMWMVKDILKERYIHGDELDSQRLSYGAVKGLVSALEDPYTEYMDPKDTAEFNNSLNSQLQGIGAELTVRDGFLTVISTLDDSPARKAGLMPDDIVLKIDGQEAQEMTLYEAITKIRGEKDTEVNLTIARKTEEKPFDLKLKREDIKVKSVTSEELEEGIWLVSVNQFSDDTKSEYERILGEIKLKNPKGIVLDLRFNGGGYLYGAIDIVSPFIRGEKQIVSIEYRDENNNEKLKTSGKDIFANLPLVVLINQGSASASEIVAAAFQDMKRAIIMGEKSYGKGTVQEVDPLPDGSSLRYTIAKWYSPSGKSIDHEGIEPDRLVEITEDDIKNKFDRQLDEAKKYLKTL